MEQTIETTDPPAIWEVIGADPDRFPKAIPNNAVLAVFLVGDEGRTTLFEVVAGDDEEYRASLGDASEAARAYLTGPRVEALRVKLAGSGCGFVFGWRPNRRDVERERTHRSVARILRRGR